MRSSVIDTLSSADVDDLPIIVKFLLQTVSAAEAAEVMWGGTHPVWVCTCKVVIYIIIIKCLASGIVVVRLEHSHGFIDNLDNHSTASVPASCRRRRPPGNWYCYWRCTTISDQLEIWFCNRYILIISGKNSTMLKLLHKYYSFVYFHHCLYKLFKSLEW